MVTSLTLFQIQIPSRLIFQESIRMSDSYSRYKNVTAKKSFDQIVLRNSSAKDNDGSRVPYCKSFITFSI